MQDYINGCYTKYGTRSMYTSEIVHKEKINSTYSFAVGYIDTEKDGISIDIFKDGEILCWEHGIISIFTAKKLKTMKDFSIFRGLAVSRLREMKLI